MPYPTGHNSKSIAYSKCGYIEIQYNETVQRNRQTLRCHTSQDLFCGNQSMKSICTPLRTTQCYPHTNPPLPCTYFFPHLSGMEGEGGGGRVANKSPVLKMGTIPSCTPVPSPSLPSVTGVVVLVLLLFVHGVNSLANAWYMHVLCPTTSRFIGRFVGRLRDSLTLSLNGLLSAECMNEFN